MLSRLLLLLLLRVDEAGQDRIQERPRDVDAGAHDAHEEQRVQGDIAQLSSVAHPEDPTQPREWLLWHNRK